MSQKGSPDLPKVLLGGVLALVVAMGVGRFAYTPLLPPMQRAVSLSDDWAGYLASANYAGYLLGAVWAAYGSLQAQPERWLRLGLLANLATTAGMGLVAQRGLWLGLRFASGLSSAVVFVLASGLVLQALVRHHRQDCSGWLYAGVGAGIALTGLLVPLLDTHCGWRGGWLGLAALCALLACGPWAWLNGPAETAKADPTRERRAGGRFEGFLPWLTAAYFCEGLGYIVTGTFLVALLQKMPGLAGAGAASWTVVGLAAVPSCVLWTRLGMRIGPVRGLILAHLVQSLGILLPVIAPGAAGALVGALLFGGTFMGIVTLSLSLGRALAPARPGRTIGLLTAAYGTGQIIGPAAAGLLAEATDSFFLPLAGAAAAVALGALCLLVGSRRAGPGGRKALSVKFHE